MGALSVWLVVPCGRTFSVFIMRIRGRGLSLSARSMNKHRRPFRFLGAWLTHPDFNKVVKDDWNPGIPLSMNLCHLQTSLQAWNKNVFGHIFARKKRLMNRLLGQFPKLSTFQIDNLGREVSNEEIHRALFSMNGFKAPGSDGFHAIFFQSQWNLHNLCWRLGNGNQVDFWYHHWVPKTGALYLWSVQPNLLNQGPVTVVEFLSSSGYWKESDLREAVLPPAVDRILQMHPLALERLKILWRCPLPMMASFPFPLPISSLKSEYSIPHWPILFAVSLDAIWRIRNELVFDQKRISTAAAGYLIKRSVDNIVTAIGLNNISSVPGLIAESASIRWSPPSDGWFKINCDGSFRSGSNQASCGGIIMNALGVPLCDFASHLGDCSITLAEIWDILHGLKVAKSHNCMHVIVESDSLVAIRLCVKGTSKFHPASQLVLEIHRYLSSFVAVKWQHVFREANQVADRMANLGHDVNCNLVVFDRIPAHCYHLLVADAAFISFPRGM
ncbi:Ribonuclease H domain [Sesbania bispinosa]|nr:Ribonuclease H domain [Sesbania bispinosa]